MASNKNLNLLDQFEVGGNYFELIEFSLERHLENGEIMRGIYGVNVAKVREVVHMPKVNPLASRIPGIAGIFELRGVPIPAINLCQILGDNHSPIHENQQIIVTEFSTKRAGFIVAVTHRIRRIAWDQVLPPSSDEGSCMSGMILIENNEFLFILDLEKILNDIEVNNGTASDHSAFAHNEPPPPPSASTSAHEFSAPVDLNSPGILFVDDSKLVLNNVSRALLARGFRVLTAQNGQEALEKLNDVASGRDLAFGHINCIITDVEMPLMDGFTLVRTIREDKQYDQLPILMHTSLSGEVSQKAGLNLGANGYVVKNDLRNLFEALEKILDEMPFTIGA